MKKRVFAALLSVVMVFTMIPFMGATAYAENTKGPGDEYVSLPITIRDYAADGMLFEWNDMSQTGTLAYSQSYSIWAKNPSNWSGNNYCGIRIMLPGNSVWKKTSKFWHCIICNSDGTIVKVYPSGSVKSEYDTLMTSGRYAVWAWIGDTRDNTYAYNAIKDIVESNKANYKIIDNDDNTITVQRMSGSGVYHHGSTKGFSLLDTSNATHNDPGMSIAGTELKQRGTWNQSTPVTGEDYTLNSGAVQTLYGCYVRTNLVEAKLSADKKPVYTQATVEYIARYMQQTLPEKWQNSDGSYNMWFVMGTKLFDSSNNYVGNTASATRDLAEVFRNCITSGLGSYADSAAKTLTQPKDCRTYFDAAYFLLQSLYSDNSGYGQTAAEYHQVNLVKKGNAYVYNSAYDGSVYDAASGVIYNSQTEKITTRGNTYVRGNPQAEARFDPINGKYYGNNGNRYLEIVDPNQNDLTQYYKNTNYNMTLEGHAQFIFYEDDNLYFNFTGDDDVYLYINGIRVLDMGGGHAISKCGITLNKVKELCGLKDGQVYDFDFYYMERHGTAANFGIETNIKIVDPSMLTEKAAYQNGTAVGNYGFVDPSQPVRYQFKLTNNGDAKIEELTFKDNDIGVSLSKDTISLNSTTRIADLYASVADRDGKEKAYYAVGELTENALKDLLKNGLDIGDTISIFGFNYTIPSGSWSNDNRFTNTVYTTAVSNGENASHKTLNGIATCTVQKQHFVYAGIHYYEWKGHGVTATNAELIEAVTKAGVAAPGENIQLCGPNGKTDSSAINENAKRTSDGITYTGIKTGSDTYYYKVGDYGPVAVTVYSYDVADNVYVLDYSLPVELNGADFGLMVNDTLNLTENPYRTTAGTLGIIDGSRTENYGSFTYGTETGPTSLKYTMSKFMNGEDSVKVRVQVLEDSASEVTTRTGVVMEETVKVVPANVVYYEDDFPGITYIDTDKNGWAHYKTEDSEGNEQSADQDSPYGSDPNYQEDKGTGYELVLDTSDLNAYQQEIIKYLNDQLGLSGGDSSNGTISALVVKETADVMSFEFRGTGFEIVSRTTQEQYAVFSVKIERKNSDGTYTVVRQFPVITESKGGDLYQVPVISATGMEAAEYRVTLRAAGSTAAKTRILYIDGVRIYEPLDGLDYADYYNPDEAHAKFYEVKDLIGTGKAIYADISDTGNDVTLVAGTTLIENQFGEQLLDTILDVDQYLKLGPNNELYLNGISSNAFLAFYLYPDAGVADNARTIEVGAHRKADYEFGPDPVNLIYGSTADAILNGDNSYSVESGTEQYYEIDVSKLVYEEANARYLLLVGTNDGDHSYAALSLTNLKVSGYTIGYTEQETKAAAAANAIENSPALTAFKAMQDHYKSLVPQEPVDEPSDDLIEEPEVNENLVINSAVLQATKIVSGKNATLTAKVSGDAASIVVLDADGNAVEFKKSASSTKNDIITFKAVWSVTGNRGDALNFTVVVYDSNGLRSSNTVPLTVTIK